MAETVEQGPVIVDDRQHRPMDEDGLDGHHRSSAAGALHRFLGGFPTAFFTLSLLTDYTYMQSANLQWQYFSIWLITAALILGGLAVLAGIVDWATGGARGRRGVLWHFGLTVVALIVGLINAFIHSRDGWVAVVPEGILLSLLTVILLYAGGIVAGVMDRPRTRREEVRA